MGQGIQGKRYARYKENKVEGIQIQGYVPVNRKA